MRNSSQTEIWRNFPLYFGFFMALLYLVSAAFVLFNKEFMMQNTYRYLFAIILAAYGIIRGIRAYQKFKNASHHSDLI